MLIGMEHRKFLISSMRLAEVSVCLTEAEEEHVQQGEESEAQADVQKKKRNTTGKKLYHHLETRPAIIH